MQNVCKFMPVSSNKENIHVINFVYETSGVENFQHKISSVYRINYVNSGTAIVQCGAQRKTVKQGDVFFIFPSVPFVIEGNSDFTYSYVSFLGSKATRVLERFNINFKNYAFYNLNGIAPVWEKVVDISSTVGSFAYESVIFYTLACIGDNILSVSEDNSNLQEDKFLLIKKYVDDNFSSCDFSLEKTAKEFSYNKKYLSTAFKKYFKIGFIEYLNTIRINQACALMEQNYTCVSDIAYLCGFSDPLYFSRLFKAKMKVSPKEFMKSLSK